MSAMSVIAGDRFARGLVEPRDGFVVRLGQVCCLLYVCAQFGAFVEYNPIEPAAAAVFGLGLVYLLLTPTQRLASMRLPSLLFVYVAWVLFSLSWNTNQQMWMLLARVEFLSMPVLLVVAATLPIGAIVRSLLASMYVCIAWTVIVTIGFYSRTSKIIAPDGSTLIGWHGDFIHKNTMGDFLLIALVAIWVLETRQTVRRLAIVTIVVLVIGSRSATALAGLFVFAGLLVWSRHLRDLALASRRRRGAFIAGTVLFVALAVVLSLVLLPLIIGALGRDLTLSGRTEIWSQVTSLIAERPIQGYGPGGVWFDPTSEVSQHLLREIGFPVAHSHNGVLELMLQLGLVGVGIVAAIYATCFTRAWQALAIDPTIVRWALLTPMMIGFTSLTESTLTAHWVGYLLFIDTIVLRVGSGDVERELTSDDASR